MTEVVVFAEVPSGSRNKHELDEELALGFGNRAEAERVVEEARSRVSTA